MRVAADVWMVRQWAALEERASGLGHHLADPSPDTEVSLVAECIGCDEIFAVDGQEKPYQYGRGLSFACTRIS